MERSLDLAHNLFSIIRIGAMAETFFKNQFCTVPDEKCVFHQEMERSLDLDAKMDALGLKAHPPFLSQPSMSKSTVPF